MCFDGRCLTKGEKGVTSGAVCVAMVMLAAGQDRTGQVTTSPVQAVTRPPAGEDVDRGMI